MIFPGAPSAGGSILRQVEKIREHEAEMQGLRQRLQQLDLQLRDALPKAKRHKTLTNQRDMRVSG